ncbi:MAG TPA: TetR family transcriptional regulator [Acidimicrobiales bacterium]|nr:TetR family transcriptional regulator [Acidimicrobiales bacterium]
MSRRKTSEGNRANSGSDSSVSGVESPGGVPARRLIAERNVDAILDGTERLLRSGRALNFSAVAAEAQVSRPTVYSHFADRQLLVAALVRRSVDQAMRAFEDARVDEGDPVEALRRLLATGWEHLARHLEIARAAAGDLPAAGLHAQHLEAERMIERLIERGQAEGSFRDGQSATWLATSSLALIHAAASLVNEGRMNADDAQEALTATVVDMCVERRRRRAR